MRKTVAVYGFHSAAVGGGAGTPVHSVDERSVTCRVPHGEVNQEVDFNGRESDFQVVYSHKVWKETPHNPPGFPKEIPADIKSETHSHGYALTLCRHCAELSSGTISLLSPSAFFIF